MKPRQNSENWHMRRRIKVGAVGETLAKRGQGHLETQHGCLANWQDAKAQWLVLHIVAFLPCETTEAGTYNVRRKEENWQPLELELASVSPQSFITRLKSCEDIKDKPLKGVFISAKICLERLR